MFESTAAHVAAGLVSPRHAAIITGGVQGLLGQFALSAAAVAKLAASLSYRGMT